jgi:hypothetical protein
MTKAITKALITLAVAVAHGRTQAPIGIRPVTPDTPQLMMPGRHLEATRPLLGYVADSSNILHSVVGSATHPLWGNPLSLPDPTAVAFLPPRQEYALLASEAGLSVARLSRSAIYPGVPIPHAMARPDRVAFSPSGEAAAMLSASESRVEVITQVASQGQVRWSLPVANPNELRQFTLSDDGELLVAAFANQPVMFSERGAPWQPLATNYYPDAWTFLPASHDLVISDRAQKTVAVLPRAERPLAARVLTSAGIDADLLAPNKQGSQLLAVATGTSACWSIDLLTGAIAPLPVAHGIDSLTLLRDGQTFLVSTKESPVVVKLSGAAAQSAATNISH